MNIKLFLTIAAVVAMLYALAFLLIPADLVGLFGGLGDPHVYGALRLFGAAMLAWGLIMWFARDFRDWDAVRGVLTGTVVGLVVLLVVNIWNTMQGVVNARGWSSTTVLALLLLGALYSLSTGLRKAV